MNTDLELREKQFLEELRLLTLKYRLRIWGCGCCGTPALLELEKEEETGHYIYEREVEWVTQ